MKIFLTGATGFIGSAVIPELLAAGHTVLGMTRSDAGAAVLTSAGAEAHRGNLDDVETLKSGAAAADGVIHCAFDHEFTDFSKFAESCAKDKRAIETLGAVLAGSNRPLIVSGGIGPWTPGRVVTEAFEAPATSPFPRVSEETAMALVSQGVNAGVVRLSQIHDTEKQGLVTPLIAIAREKRVSAYVGDGSNRWPAAHIRDVARLYVLAIEKHEPGARYHAVAEEGVRVRDIAEAVGRGLKIPAVSIPPAEATEHFGPFLGTFAGLDIIASNAITRERLGWNPTHRGMIADLDEMRYD